MNRKKIKGKMKTLKSAAGLLMLAVLVSMVIASCSDDEEPHEVIHHQSYVQGKLNDTIISMNDINARILWDKSHYDFIVTDGSDIPSVLNWGVRLIDTPDSVVTLFLHISRLKRTNSVIYSPNSDPDANISRDSCYVTVEDTKTGVSTIYHPTNRSPISARWEFFMVTPNNRMEKHEDVTWEYPGREWPGITGRLHGTFTSDGTPVKKMTIDFDFRLY